MNRKKLHLILQGKGGVGKSMIAAVLAQYKLAKGVDLLCIDTDPVNATFSGYEALTVRRLDILEGDEINSRNFDALVELASRHDGDVIIDNGASSFVPLSHYLVSNQVPALLGEMGFDVVVHTVITGGQALLDTLNGFSQLVTQYPKECTFVVWLNPFWGPIEHEGKGFEQLKVYLANKNKIAAIVTLPFLKAETHGRDFSEIQQERLTFDQAQAQARFSIMMRQRLKLIKADIFNQLDGAAAAL